MKTGLDNQSICKPPKRDGTRCPGGKRFMLACHTCCKCSTETTRNLVKFKLGIKVMKYVKSLLEVTVTGQGSEYHLIFVKKK